MALDILVHELVHTIVGDKHDEQFLEVAKAIGLDNTGQYAGAEEVLLERLRDIKETLGKYPTVGDTMNEREERTCCRPDEPDCQWFSSKHFRCINWKCSRERGTNIPGICDCSYYKPMGQTHEEILEELQGGFWSGAMFGVMVGGSIVLIIFTFIMLLGML